MINERSNSEGSAMKKLMIEVTGANGEQSVSILTAIYEIVRSCDKTCAKPIEVTYRYEKEAIPIPPAPESTPFSRYISNTTSEGRT